ncbi:DDE-type integrase/transposase/recombinase [Micromonospora sp. NPDC049662]|uniref:DDE-type integrase/transposase/recombinase n=1 Tax=Micromonospora sp. NPDC049662 TaxID=3155397 RepID=UPI00343D4680
MRAADLAGKNPRRWRTTTIPDPNASRRPDLIGPDFTANPAAVDTRWCGEITYINTWQGWLYLATVIDLASRRVVGWAIAEHLKTDLIDAALTDALVRRRPTSGAHLPLGPRLPRRILHPTRGVGPGRGPSMSVAARD